MTIKEFTIDAAGKSLGRLASEVAVILRGKNEPTFKPNLLSGNKVKIVNASLVKVTGAKTEQKTYFRHTGYPGGGKSPNLAEVASKKGYGELIRKAVHGMLPGNRLRTPMLKNLEISE